MKTLSLNILDIVQNSIRAKADEIYIEIKESAVMNLYRITIKDNGTGIPEEILKNVTDPFITTRTKRRMGLGLALLKHHSELAGGSLEINSETGKGTQVTATFLFDHIDRQPLGDMVGVIKIMLAGNPEINFIYRHITEKGEYTFSSMETMEYLEVDNFYDNILLEDLSNLIYENLKEIEASDLVFKKCIRDVL